MREKTPPTNSNGSGSKRARREHEGGRGGGGGNRGLREEEEEDDIDEQRLLEVCWGCWFDVWVVRIERASLIVSRPNLLKYQSTNQTTIIPPTY